MSKKGCLRCLIATVVVVGLFFLFAWLITAQIHSPKCSIEKFYVPALDKAFSSNKSAATASNTTISFDLRFKNENGGGSGVYYDTLNISVYYYQKGNTGGELKRLPIGDVSIPRFYQAKVDHCLETVQTFGVPWEEARMAVANGSSTATMFRLDLVSSIRLKIPFRYVVTTDRKKLNLGVNVTVNDQGMKTVPGSLRLISASPHITPCCILILVLSVLCLNW
ncbi:hypothetical protein MKW94_030134 [Papaver nudicaule]|uniref:Late embryogenesis abundant protein LEA-2 subgroup domain-containing protein n=1 Tax=Papaver nudicaule TaxID=74823 RepID=A0AA41VPA8_PAPNU|nr:hypothetical protein [Papaver nudicaule]